MSLTSLSTHEADISTESDDKARANKIFELLSLTGVIPISVLGLAANAVCIWVWSYCQKRNPIILLFQVKAVSDMFYLLNMIVRSAFSNDIVTSFSLHCTVVIGVIRWMAIARPHRMKSMFQRHVLVICAAVGGWCLLMGTLVLVMVRTLRPGTTRYQIMDGVLEIVMFVIPTLILVGFSIALLKVTFQQRHNIQLNKRRFEVTQAVLCIVGTAVLVFIVGMFALFLGAIFPDRSDQGCTYVCVVTGYAVALVLFVSISSINFLFYYFFASEFRFYFKVVFCKQPLTRPGEVASTNRIQIGTSLTTKLSRVQPSSHDTF